MARTTAALPPGSRLTDYISLGVLTASFPIETVGEVLLSTGCMSQRERSLPAHVMVYYAIVLALYADVSTREVLRCLLEGVRWLGDPVEEGVVGVPGTIVGKSGISQARTRLGAAPLEALYRAVVEPVAVDGTRGAWYRGWRVMSMDGTTLDVGDTRTNARAFGRPVSPRGANTTGAFPQLRIVGLLETGTHVITGAQIGGCRTGERALAIDVLPYRSGDMLCLADRGFMGFDLWRQANATGAALLWRAGAQITLPVITQLPDRSYLSELRWNKRSGSPDRAPIPVRVIEYTLPNLPSAESSYRVVTNILEPRRAPAAELASLYHERWEMENAFDEFKTHLRGPRRVLRSKTPQLVLQEAWGFLLAHSAIRALMHEAVLGTSLGGSLGTLPRTRDPDTLSFTHALRVTRRTLPHMAADPRSRPRASSSLPSSDTARTPGRTRQLKSGARRTTRSKAKDE